MNRRLDEQLIGVYCRILKGQGIDFEKIWEYIAHDNVRSIDWKIDAKMNCRYIK
jgi:uncharacterized protein (DUF58 family)